MKVDEIAERIKGQLRRSWDYCRSCEGNPKGTCRDCDGSGKDESEIQKSADRIAKSIADLDRWIPVEERLPKDGTKVQFLMHHSGDECEFLFTEARYIEVLDCFETKRGNQYAVSSSTGWKEISS